MDPSTFGANEDTVRHLCITWHFFRTIGAGLVAFYLSKLLELHLYLVYLWRHPSFVLILVLELVLEPSFP